MEIGEEVLHSHPGERHWQFDGGGLEEERSGDNPYGCPNRAS